MRDINSIEEVIKTLGNIIIESESEQDPSGYFAALYQKVTIKVKEGIEAGAFEDGARMEQLDIVFAKRYLEAYFAYKKGEAVSQSWRNAFDTTTDFWPIVLQHLLMGMNAHINLDLGIAAAEISTGENINSLLKDFNKINKILSSLVKEVEDNLSTIWPKLKWILQKTNRADDFMADFSMELARNGAWKFASSIVGKSETELNKLVKARDNKVAKKAEIIFMPGKIIRIILAIIRLGEKGTVSEKIKELKTPLNA